jgi:hypothetical protein
VPLQMFTMDHMPALSKVVRSATAMLRFPGVVRGTMAPLSPCEPSRVTMPISHSSEHDTLPIAFLICLSKPFDTGQVVAPVVLGCLLLRLSP